ncbi:hypothetical protein BDM02DRAFT_1659186 [Thelephora ganbajun]|uniref:Uncharacterized protein n=1 Tax=Thelephora ganbajun TaxID=370292 RepID=A0ACB6ZX72_THEGA|nr:hypothetical protein BDM02DRAFT_1659186 [Thelephora ganbajun]
MIDRKAAESSNIRLPVHGVPGPIQERDVDDLRSFRKAIYESVIVTAMEMARLLYGSPYEMSYRYSRDSTVNLVRNARWDVLPYAQTEPVTKPNGIQISHKSDKPNDPKMVVICVPPWDLSRLDLQDFATRKSVSAWRVAQHTLLITLIIVHCCGIGPDSR